MANGNHIPDGEIGALAQVGCEELSYENFGPHATFELTDSDDSAKVLETMEDATWQNA